MAQAYHGGGIAQAAQAFGLPADSLLDFSANINVFAPSIPSAVWERWRTDIIRYPEADAESIRQRIASVYGVNANHILPTAGAIEGLYLAARLFSPANVGKVGVIEPSFSDYTRAFEAAGCKPERITLPLELWHRPAAEWAHLLEPFDVIVLGNPNNPTGALQSRTQLSELFSRPWSRTKSWIVDEAFIEFVAGEESLLGELEKFPSLLVLRSLTKSWAIPGLRLGFIATSNPQWIEQLGSMQPPWSINAPAAAWASEFLTHDGRRDLMAGLGLLREAGVRFANALKQIPGVKVHPSACNFLLIEITDSSFDADAVYSGLGQRGILVRRCDSFHGMPKGRFIRLAVRSDAENVRLLEELSTVCQDLRRGAA